LKGKSVFVRADLNVPLSKETGEITDDTRIRSSVPTIQYLRENGARVVLTSHLGRPKGQVVDSMTLAPVAARLSEILGTEVEKANDCIGDEVSTKVDALKEGGVLLLENLRFHKGETKNDATFNQALVDSTKAEVYVNDAFGTSHRAHSSTVGVPGIVSGPSVAGFLLEKEIKYLSGVLEAPVKPFVAIIGGAKVSTKLPVLESLLGKCDKLVIGGAMCFTFYKAQGYNTGNSLVEDDQLEAALDLLKKAKAAGVEVVLPTDAVIATAFEENAEFKTVSVTEIPDGWIGLDIGCESISTINNALADAQTVVWNGPMGVFEWANFNRGTFTVAETLAERTAAGCITIVGGGDSVAAVEKMGISEKFSHISTGGGACLEMLEGKALPGVLALDEA